MKIAITGASGLVGRALAARLAAAGHQVAGFGRGGAQAEGWPEPGQVARYRWNLMEQAPTPPLLGEAEAVVHLAGETVAQRWSQEAKLRIFNSRQTGTRNLVNALAGACYRGALVSASAVGFYGSRGDELLEESAGPGQGFLAEVCQAWENAALSAAPYGMRVVRARIGVALTADGGALRKMLPPFRLGLGGPVGAGAQWMSWIHLLDLVRLLQWMVEEPVSGAFNAVAPEPAQNVDFAAALGRTLHRPAQLGAPEWILRAALGEMSQVVLGSQRAVPNAALEAGFRFDFPSLGPTLEDLLRR